MWTNTSKYPYIPLRCVRTRVSPSGATGSVIQEPNLDPDVLMVMGSLIPVSLPHAGRKEVRREYLEQCPFGYYIDHKFSFTSLMDENIDVLLGAK